MSVELSPHSQLGFNRPLTQMVTKTLVIHNPHPQPVAFKVKTTAPKQYCVRPNSGRIDPGSKVEVTILLQPMREEPPINAKCKDKFLVQSAYIAPDDEVKSLGDMWAEVEKQDKSAIHEQKIRCVFLAEDQSIPEGIVVGAGDVSHLNESQTFTHAPQEASSPSPRTPSAPEASGYATGLPSFTKDQGETRAPAVTDNTTKPEASGEERIAELVRENERLRKELESAHAITGLRQRSAAVVEKAKAGDIAGAGAEVKTAVQSDGVPFPVVASACLAVFVVTYLFF